MTCDALEPGASFDRAATEYGRGRPGYPDEVVAHVPLARESTVVDLAAGTGKLTAVLARHYRRVVAVEPLPAMRALIERELPGVEALDGRAEAMPLADGAADAVFVGQAFHWFANDAAVAEIARVLRPGGALALLWNEPDPKLASPLPAPYRRRFDELRAEVALPSAADWRETVAGGPFDEPVTATAAHEQVSDRGSVLAFAASMSWIASRGEAERQRVLDELGALLPDGDYVFPMIATVHWMRRR